jgi:hypothetical protein
MNEPTICDFQILSLKNVPHSYAKQLIEDTIRRNTSPIRLDSANQEDCCSLASSSASDDTAARVQHTSNNRNSIGASILSQSAVAAGNAAGLAMAPSQFMPSHQMPPHMGGGGGGVMQMMHAGKMARNGGPMGGGQPPNLLLHSFSTNDASLGEYKYTVNVGQHNIKITGECFDLVRVSCFHILFIYFPVLTSFLPSRWQNSSSTTTSVATNSWPLSIWPATNRW